MVRGRGTNLRLRLLKNIIGFNRLLDPPSFCSPRFTSRSPRRTNHFMTRKLVCASRQSRHSCHCSCGALPTVQDEAEWRELEKNALRHNTSTLLPCKIETFILSIDSYSWKVICPIRLVNEDCTVGVLCVDLILCASLHQ